MWTKTLAICGLVAMLCFAPVTSVLAGDSNITQKAKDFAEKQAYKQSIGTAAGVLVGRTAGGVIGGVATPTKTVDQKTEMQQRNQAIRENMRDHGSPFWKPGQPVVDRVR
jgi:hypothetical protein